MLGLDSCGGQNCSCAPRLDLDWAARDKLQNILRLKKEGEKMSLKVELFSDAQGVGNPELPSEGGRRTGEGGAAGIAAQKLWLLLAGCSGLPSGEAFCFRYC